MASLIKAANFKLETLGLPLSEICEKVSRYSERVLQPEPRKVPNLLETDSSKMGIPFGNE